MTLAARAGGLPSFTLALLLVLSPVAAFSQESGPEPAPDHGVAAERATAPAGQRVRHRKRTRRHSDPRTRLRPKRRSEPTTPVPPQHRLR